MRKFTKVVMGIPGPRHILTHPALQNQSFHKTVRPLSWVGATSSMNMTVRLEISSMTIHPWMGETLSWMPRLVEIAWLWLGLIIP